VAQKVYGQKCVNLHRSGHRRSDLKVASSASFSTSSSATTRSLRAMLPRRLPSCVCAAFRELAVSGGSCLRVCVHAGVCLRALECVDVACVALRAMGLHACVCAVGEPACTSALLCVRACLRARVCMNAELRAGCDHGACDQQHRHTRRGRRHAMARRAQLDGGRRLLPRSAPVGCDASDSAAENRRGSSARHMRNSALPVPSVRVPGGGFSDTAATRGFFVGGRKFRTGGFLATSFSKAVAENIFIHRVRHATCATQHTACGTAVYGSALACVLVRALPCELISSLDCWLVCYEPKAVQACARARAPSSPSGRMLVQSCVLARVSMCLLRGAFVHACLSAGRACCPSAARASRRNDVFRVTPWRQVTFNGPVNACVLWRIELDPTRRCKHVNLVTATHGPVRAALRCRSGVGFERIVPARITHALSSRS
jgi:hypothetical protein